MLMSSPPEGLGSKPRKRKATGVVVPHPPRWYQWIVAWLIVVLVRVVSATLRFRWKDDSQFFDTGQNGPAIYCAWHNRLALSMSAYYNYAKKRTRSLGMAAMVSASKDGAFLAAILHCYKVHPIRGSSSRRGPQALLELTTWAERRFDLAITPDGPRGPCYEVQDGVMSLAQVTGLPIIPFSCQLDWKLRLKSWDRFQIPLPFSTCEMMLGKPVRVPREATDEERENLRRQLEHTMRSLTRD
jgi:lysophospholipid acyltransferase (LPLAT)-like uncharacterized protein